MKPLPLALGAATLVVFAAIAGFAASSEVGWDVPWLFIYSDAIAKVLIFLSLAVVGWAMLQPNRAGEVSHILHSLALLTGGLGLLATVLLYNNPGLISVNVTKANNLNVMGDKYAQDLMPLAFGLLAATVATARAGKPPAGA